MGEEKEKGSNDQNGQCGSLAEVFAEENDRYGKKGYDDEELGDHLEVQADIPIGPWCDKIAEAECSEEGAVHPVDEEVICPVDDMIVEKNSFADMIDVGCEPKDEDGGDDRSGGKELAAVFEGVEIEEHGGKRIEEADDGEAADDPAAKESPIVSGFIVIEAGLQVIEGSAKCGDSKRIAPAGGEEDDNGRKKEECQPGCDAAVSFTCYELVQEPGVRKEAEEAQATIKDHALATCYLHQPEP